MTYNMADTTVGIDTERINYVTVTLCIAGDASPASPVALTPMYTMYTFLGLLPPNGIFPAAKFTLRLSLAFSYIDSITARHSSSGRQPNFAAWYME